MEKIIGVIGSSSTDDRLDRLAQSVGKEVGRSGCSLICGGLGGVMTAVCRGMKRLDPPAKGRTIGVLPGIEKENANPYLDFVIPSGIGFARNMIITLTADGVIAVGGGSGTLTEIAYAWKFKRPIVILAPAGGWSEMLGGRKVDDMRNDVIMTAPDPESAVKMILERI